MKFDFFDCNVQIGRFAAPVPEQCVTPAQLMEQFAPLGIYRALAFHALAKELHPVEGNRALIEEIKDLDITPCWVALPHYTGEMPDPQAFIGEMQQAGVRAVRLFPRLHDYAFRPWCIGEMMAEFQTRQVPVLMSLDQASFDDIASILAAFPRLRLILLDVSYGGDRCLYPLMQQYKHVCFEISTYVVTGGIEAVCRRFGAQRMLFGTQSPFLDPGAAVSLVTLADISDKDKQLIAGGNLERLLGWY
jgi:hypothetical protein